MRDFTLQKIVILNGLATLHEVKRAMWATQETRHTWLEELVRSQDFDEERYVDLVAKHLYMPRCDLRRLARVPREVLALIPAEVAAEHRVVPISVERDGDLHVVLGDPTDARAFEEIQFFAGRRLLRELAAPSAMAAALAYYYGVPNVLDPMHEVRVATPIAMQ